MIRRFILILLAVCGYAATVHAQQLSQGTPDCNIGIPVMTAVGTSRLYQNTGQNFGGCNEWNLAYNVDGWSSVTFQIVDAPRSSSAAGTPVAFQGTIVTGANPTTISSLPNSGIVSVSGYFPYMGVAITSASGTGTLTGTLYGWRKGPQPTGSAPISSTGVVGTLTAPITFNSAGVATPLLVDASGELFVRTGGPNPFTCYARGVAASLTDFTQVSGIAGCGAQTTPGLRLYITDITVQSTTTTAGTFRLSFGTGAACATTNTPVFPANTSDAFTYPPSNANQPFQVTFNQPIASATAQRLCVVGTATNTANISVNGFIGP